MDIDVSMRHWTSSKQCSVKGCMVVKAQRGDSRHLQGTVDRTQYLVPLLPGLSLLHSVVNRLSANSSKSG